MSSPDPPDLKAAAEFLAASDADWARLVEAVGPCRLSVDGSREPYEALVRAIAFQQIHGRAAEAILCRFLGLYPGAPFPAPESVLASESSLLRAVGFSRAKIAAIRAIAFAAADGIVPTRADAAAMDDDTLIERLVSIRGVGRWTVEMLLIFTLGRPDVLPADDFGVREGWRVLKGLDQQPTARELAAASVHLSPWRSAASWYLWRAADSARERQRAAKSAPT